MTLRRTSSTRYRVLIVLAICLLVWHQYQRPMSVTLDEVTFDEQIDVTYPEEREKMAPLPRIDEEVERLVDSTTSVPDEQESIFELESSLPEDPENDDHPSSSDPPAEKVPLGMSVEKELRNEEPEDDEAPEKLSSPKPKDASEKHNHPLLVMEASQKLIDQHRSPTVQVDPNNDTVRSWSEGPGTQRRFPEFFEYAALGEKAEALPDIIHIPFEDPVSDVTLKGWEDLWFSEARLNISKYGLLNETKIDFIYTCKACPTFLVNDR